MMMRLTAVWDLESYFGSLKEHLISTCGSVKNKIKEPLYGRGPGNFQWQKAFVCSRNPAILNKVISNKDKFHSQSNEYLNWNCKDK